MVKAGHTYRLLTDHLGSVGYVVNIDTGEVSQALEYDEWGKLLRDSNPGYQPFGYAGGLYDPDTGLVRFGMRDYDPREGRWLTKDPIGLQGGYNVYSYVEGNPISRIDPLGLQYAGGFTGRPFVPVTNPAWRDVFNNVGNLPVPAPSLPGEYPGVNVPPSVPFVPATGKPVCMLVCPNDGNQCRPASTNGFPSSRNPGCYEVCYEHAMSPY